MTCKFKEEDETILFGNGCYYWCEVGFVSFQHKERSVWFFGCFSFFLKKKLVKEKPITRLH
jgi:hypothetical protein